MCFPGQCWPSPCTSWPEIRADQEHKALLLSRAEIACSYSFNTLAVRWFAPDRYSSLVWPQGVFMMATSPSLKREVNDLVLEQIHAFKQPADITD